MKRAYYVLNVIKAWDSLTPAAPLPFPVEVKPPAGCVGYLLVFDSKEALIAAGLPGDTFAEVWG